MGWRVASNFSVTLIVLLGILLFGAFEVRAQTCKSDSACDYLCTSDFCSNTTTCSASCEYTYTNTEGSCYTTCKAQSGTSTCQYWTEWGPCSGGWQSRYCTVPSGNNESQIQSCTSGGGGGGGGGGDPSPTAPPSCTATNPTAVVLSSPANGANLSTLNVTLSWNATTNWGTGCPQDNRYVVRIGETSPPGTVIATTTSTSTSFTAETGKTYYWRVRTHNGSNTADSAIWSFSVQAAIQGNVYIDNGNICSTATPSNLGGLSASVRGTAYTSAVSMGDGSYSILAPPGTYNNLDLLGLPAGYYCSTGCLQSCPTIPTVTSSSLFNNFFVTTQLSGWWQAEGASIYAGSQAGGVTVKSSLPSASTDLILPGTGGTVGALIRGSGNPSLGLGAISAEEWSAVSTYRGKRMDYNYFAASMGVVRNSPSDWETDNLNMQTGERDFWYAAPSSGVATIASPWLVASDEKQVVFVNGDLRIESDIEVEPGGFLALIVSGNIVIDPLVNLVEGILISSGNFETESAYEEGVVVDSQLNTSGSIITWGSMVLTRNLGPGNNSTPAEKFSYRPDMLISMPEKMKTFAMQWEEVVAGSFE